MTKHSAALSMYVSKVFLASMNRKICLVLSPTFLDLVQDRPIVVLSSPAKDPFRSAHLLRLSRFPSQTCAINLC